LGKYEKFFKFIQYTLDSNGQDIPDDNRMDWQNLYRFAHQQSILGVVYAGVKRLGEQGGKPPFDILMELVTIAEQIKGQNRLLNKRCIEVVKEYRDAGFLCCVLKG